MKFLAGSSGYHLISSTLMLFLSLFLVACGGDSKSKQASRLIDPFNEIESSLAALNVSTASLDGMWILVVSVDEAISVNESIEEYNYTRYQVLQFDQGVGGAISYDNCAGNIPYFGHVFGYNLTATGLTIPVNDFFHVDYEIDATVHNNTIVDLGEFRASGNNSITYRAKAYKFRDNINKEIGSLNSNIGSDPVHCLTFDTGQRTALFTEGAGTVPFHSFSINNNNLTNNSIWMRNIEEQSTPVASDIIYTDSGELYSQDKQAVFKFNQSTFPHYNGNFSLIDAESGLTAGTFTINLSN
jgi:hypothetical protein